METIDEQQKVKRKGLVRRFGGWWVGGWASALGRGLRPGELAGSPRAIKRFKSRLQGLKSLRQNRDSSQFQIRNFNDLLLHWGIQRKEIPAVIRNLIAEAVIFALLAAVTLGTAIWAALEGKGWIYFVYLLIILPLATTVIFSRVWRVHCLKAEEFLPFREWFGIFFGGKPETGDKE